MLGTVDHAVLISRFEHCVGFWVNALKRFQSYFTVLIEDFLSVLLNFCQILLCLPQGSILALIYCLCTVQYILPLGCSCCCCCFFKIHWYIFPLSIWPWNLASWTLTLFDFFKNCSWFFNSWMVYHLFNVHVCLFIN